MAPRVLARIIDPRQLPLSPMMIFAIGIEHAFDVTVQRPQQGVAHSIVIAVIIRASRGTLESAARVNVLRRNVLRRRREKYIIARPAQPRSVASEAGGDAICVRYVGPAEPKHIRCAGLTLLLRPLSARRCFSGEKKCKRCNTAGYLMRPHYRSL
jgi:hypothetical protein